MRSYTYFGLTAIVLVLDQLSKAVIRNLLTPGEIIRITEKFLWITHTTNSGAAFSLSLGSELYNRLFFSFIALIASLVFALLVLKSRQKIEKIVFALILGGTLGNLIDRIFQGEVTDFIWCDFPDFIMTRWPVFNLADSSIVVAIGIMIVHVLFFAKKQGAD
ncbi:MAG: signal peptidase II [Candidatus Cloacimonetes bacterium]|nr:signal peptidase II [Candidatus Cloacimonadota bacterium]